MTGSWWVAGETTAFHRGVWELDPPFLACWLTTV